MDTMPSRDELASRNLYAAMTRLAAAKRELAAAREQFTQVCDAFEAAYGFRVSEPDEDGVEPIPLMPIHDARSVA